MASEIELLDSLKDQFNLGEKDPKSYSPLVLAYVGDCIYEMIIRTVLVHKRDSQVQKLHKEATWFVKAATQAMIVEKLMPLLSEEEQDVYRRVCKSSNPGYDSRKTYASFIRRRTGRI